MGEVKVKLTDETEAIFRKNAMETFGYSKGSLSSAAEQAIKAWAGKLVEAEKMADPVGAIAGMLKHVKKSSVELQHEIGEIRRARYHAHRR